MRLSRAKINHLSKLVAEALQDESGIRLDRDANTVRLAVVKIITEEVERDSMIDDLVRDKISSQRRDFPEGGRGDKLPSVIHPIPVRGKEFGKSFQGKFPTNAVFHDPASIFIAYKYRMATRLYITENRAVLIRPFRTFEGKFIVSHPFRADFDLNPFSFRIDIY